MCTSQQDPPRLVTPCSSIEVDVGMYMIAGVKFIRMWQLISAKEKDMEKVEGRERFSGRSMSVSADSSADVSAKRVAGNGPMSSALIRQAKTYTLHTPLVTDFSIHDHHLAVCLEAETPVNMHGLNVGQQFGSLGTWTPEKVTRPTSSIVCFKHTYCRRESRVMQDERGNNASGVLRRRSLIPPISYYTSITQFVSRRRCNVTLSLNT